MIPTITTFAWVPEFARGFVRDMRPRWAFEEVGQRYAVDLITDSKTPEHRRFQPFGQVPTYRDDEVHALHPLRDLLGQLPAHSFTRLQPAPLSQAAVDSLAAEKGYNGQDVYTISGGNPFYVNEILASVLKYSNVKIAELHATGAIA